MRCSAESSGAAVLLWGAEAVRGAADADAAVPDEGNQLRPLCLLIGLLQVGEQGMDWKHVALFTCADNCQHAVEAAAGYAVEYVQLREANSNSEEQTSLVQAGAPSVATSAACAEDNDGDNSDAEDNNDGDNNDAEDKQVAEDDDNEIAEEEV